MERERPFFKSGLGVCVKNNRFAERIQGGLGEISIAVDARMI
jgi:hypothetical protein